MNNVYNQNQNPPPSIKSVHIIFGIVVVIIIIAVVIFLRLI